ncbi:MAG: MFS transporter [Acidobacteriales bacterium]|nr:MFS transporter [Terriglobales bacterium]
MFYGWAIVFAAFLTLLLTVGIPFYGLPFFYDYFIRDFGWSRAATSGGIALATILVQPGAGFLVHRYSARKLVAAGSGFLLLSLALFAIGNGSLALYYGAWCVFMAGYVCAGPLPHQIILSQWFRRNRGLAMGIAYLGLGVGGAISQKYVALPLIQHFGWRAALATMGALLILVYPLLMFIVRDRPSDKGLLPDGDSADVSTGKTEPAFEFRDLVRMRGFWLLAAGSCASIGAIGSINQHMKLIFLDAGLSGALVADTTFIILMSSLAGRVFMGWLADRLSKKLVMLAAFLLVALPLPLLLVADRPGVPTLFGCLFGFGLGADYMLIPLMAAQIFGVNSIARVMGIILPVDSIGQTCFPLVVAVLRDSFGNYTGALMLVISLALSGAAAILLLPMSRPAVSEK